MDTTIKCNNCNREIGLAEFLTYPEAYFMKLIAPALVSFIVGAIGYKLSTGTKGMIDNSMAGLAKNFSIACPNCGQTNWYPASGKKPKKCKKKNDSAAI